MILERKKNDLRFNLPVDIMVILISSVELYLQEYSFLWYNIIKFQFRL